MSDLTLGELFSKNPREMTKEDRLDVIRRMREARDQWTSEQMSAKNQGRKARPSKGLSVKAIGGVKLDDDFFSDLEK